MTDERDPKVSQRYREMPSEEPSRELDQNILAAARRSADKPHAPLVAPAGRHGWYYSLAAAAILVLAVAVTLHVERQQPDAELATPATPASPAEQKPEAAFQPAPVPAEKRQSNARQERPQAYARDPSPPAPVAAAPAPAPQVQAEVRARSEVAAENQSEAARADAASAAERPAAASGQVAPQAAPMRQSRDAVARLAAEPPERQLERIAELRKEGRHEEADKALADFRRAYPGYQIAAPMLEKVERRPAPAR
jgi:hypothetical protein